MDASISPLSWVMALEAFFASGSSEKADFTLGRTLLQGGWTGRAGWDPPEKALNFGPGNWNRIPKELGLDSVSSPTDTCGSNFDVLRND